MEELFSCTPDVYFDTNVFDKLPPRTLLYAIEPFRVGTRDGESLDSLLMRSADAHCVSFSKYYSEVIFPLFPSFLKRQSLSYAFRSETICTLNGLGKITQYLISAIAEATGVPATQSCTLFPLRKILSSYELLNNKIRFCPICFLENRSYKQYYRRLLWTMSAVAACPTHSQKLIIHTCGSNNSLPAHQRKLLFGICPKCGSVGYRCNITKPHTATEADVWRASQVGELIANCPEADIIFSQGSISTGIRKIIANIGNGTLRDASRIAQLDDEVVRGWSKGTHKPSLPLLLDLCFAANISLVSLCKGAPSRSTLGSANNSHRIRRPRRIEYKNYGEVETYLKNMFVDGSFSSLSTIEKTLRIDRRTLRKYFPGLTQQIHEHFIQNEQRRTSERRIEAIDYCEQVIAKLLQEGKALTASNFREKTGRPSMEKNRFYKAFLDLIAKRGNKAIHG